MSTYHQLTVYSAEADTIDVTTSSGPPRVMLGGYVTIQATNGEVSVTRTYAMELAPHIGDIITIKDDDDGVAV